MLPKKGTIGTVDTLMQLHDIIPAERTDPSSRMTHCMSCIDKSGLFDYFERFLFHLLYHLSEVLRDPPGRLGGSPKVIRDRSFVMVHVIYGWFHVQHFTNILHTEGVVHRVSPITMSAHMQLKTLQLSQVAL